MTIDCLNNAVAWVKQLLSEAAIKADINHRWLQLLSILFRPLLPIRQFSQAEQIQVLLSVNPLLFTNNKLREIYPTLLKGSADRLFEYLNNNPMGILLYGQSSATEIYGVL